LLLFFYRLEEKKKNLIGLSIELRRRKSFIGRIKKKRERKKMMVISFFFSLIDWRARRKQELIPETEVWIFFYQRKLLFLPM
jgi:hypothetical protein